MTEKIFLAIVAAIAIFVCFVCFLYFFNSYEECSAKGGVLLRGAVGYYCMEQPK